MTIAAFMSVCGDQRYFDLALVSIRSFRKACPNTSLYVVTDRPESIDADVKLILYEDAIAAIGKQKDQILGKALPGVYGINKMSYHVLNVPIAQHYVRDASHILLVDCDSYFAGKGYIHLLEHETKSGHDLYLAERKHPAMVLARGGKPGAGFCLWRVKSDFAEKYVEKFVSYEPATLNRFQPQDYKTKVLTRPGWHFVYPFKKNPDFGKAEAEQFLPAYFHLTEPNVCQNQRKMEEWFGGGMNKTSYVSASIMPWKLIRQAHKAIAYGQILPLYISLRPTNRCNMNCPWCSAKDRVKDQELAIGEIRSILDHFAGLGTCAINFTGGGEPTLHKDFEEMVKYARRACGMAVGITTNAASIQALRAVRGCIQWARMGWTSNESINRIQRFCDALSGVDCSLSYVVHSTVELCAIEELRSVVTPIKNFSHVRFIADLTSPERMVGQMDAVSKVFGQEKAIYQYRCDAEPGTTPCLIGLLHPIIHADGMVRPCCGIQYTLLAKKEGYQKFNMCHWSDFKFGLPAFDGAVCNKCYYAKYNMVLSKLLEPIKHKEFV